ncbi:hypothetical protein [Achromobacter phage Motura]|uniref:DUF1737 domain-containing protein n=1 Tax=Achromobacter phage Motura TaxID=2591403 RepID=A0A514CTC7_9CAUD|nr:hypothetical protein H1O15_gp105 [Achromobacter phage Motura]QDH83722.1 hypothetical protein [Achromobacter phage Motura]
MEYKIVTSHTQQGLETQVTNLMRTGWEPKGGFAMISTGTSVYWGQAMVRYESRSTAVYD